MALFSGTVSAQISTVFSSALACPTLFGPCSSALVHPGLYSFNCGAALGSVTAAQRGCGRTSIRQRAPPRSTACTHSNRVSGTARWVCHFWRPAGNDHPPLCTFSPGGFTDANAHVLQRHAFWFLELIFSRFVSLCPICPLL